MNAKKFLSFFLILLLMLAVFFVNMTYAPKMSFTTITIIRIALIIVFFLTSWLFHRRKDIYTKNLVFTLMVVNLAFLIVSFFTEETWNLNLESARGIALAKLNDSFFISTVIITSFLITGYNLKDIYLARGKLTLGILIGFLAFILMGYLALNSSEIPNKQEFLRKNMVWIFIVIFSNAFMEELLFRGIFLKRLNNYFKPIWSIILTAIVFSATHVEITYTPDILIFLGYVFILGLIWGFLTHYTKSIIASVLFHAGAGLLIIIPYYLSLGET